ncbi:MAG: hypothetical protein AAFQ91_31790 [Cyanobacteria bacterium J06621_15]
MGEVEKPKLNTENAGTEKQVAQLCARKRRILQLIREVLELSISQNSNQSSLRELLLYSNTLQSFSQNI